MKPTSDLLTITTIVFTAISMGIMIWYLVKKPRLDTTVKLVLLAGIFIFPISAATTGNVVGFQATQTRDFCGGCHVMLPYTEDSANKASTTLASLHARSKVFGSKNCYQCHQDYEMFGAITTKLVGMKHAWVYAAKYLNVSAEDALPEMHLYKPYTNDNCMQCHSTELPGYKALEDHRGALEDVRSGKQSCVSEGCHGPAHPFSKVARENEAARKSGAAP